MKKMYKKLILMFIIFFLIPISALAASANIGMSGGNVIVGKNITVTFKLNSTDTNLVSFGGTLNYDSNYLELVSCNTSSILSNDSKGNKFYFIDLKANGIKSGNIGSCTFKTKKVGSVTVGVSGAQATNSSDNISVKVSGATITIKEPPSTNNNLSSLSVTNGSISFNPSTTSYNVSVDSNISSVSISATPQDSKASVSGTGNRNLNYGNNALAVVVTAEDGSKKTYTINVSRKDDRSSNNNLSSLSVSEAKINFNKNTTSYDIEVPYSVSKVNINAKAEDPKSKVNISNPDLVAEEVRTAKVTVTAENGSTKLYSINIKRGKDPNKPLSNNNYLKDLRVSIGILSPEFDREKTNYAVYLPYEISDIEINVSVDDEKYGILEKEEPSSLTIGSNLFKYTVTAEDGSKRIYTVTVVRNKSLDEINTDSNTYLKTLVLSNGSLNKGFNKEERVIYYKKSSDNISIKEALPLDEENTVLTYQLKGAFVILVETPSGQRGFYILIEDNNILIIVIAISAIIIVGLLFVIFKKNFKKKNKKLEN